MATNWLARRSREQSIGSEAETVLGARQVFSANAKSRAPHSQDCENAFGERKDRDRSRNPTIFSRSRSRGRAEEKRSGTAGRFSRSKSRSRGEAGESKSHLRQSRSRRYSKVEEPAKDSADLPPPLLTLLDCTNVVHSDALMIGVAVGSPSQLQPTNTGSLGQSPLSKMGTEGLGANDQYFEDPINKSRNARWKKIGGLFKAKNALLNEPAPSPFYQLQAQHAAQVPNRSESSFQSHSIQPAQGGPDARFLFDKILGSDGQLDPQNYAENSLLHLHGAPHGKGDPSRPSKHTSSPRPSEQKGLPSGLPLLDVKIPDVHMERYSVMFGNLLDKEESPSLLSRRDKTLKNLLTVSDEEEEAAGAAHVHKQKSEKSEASNKEAHSHLTPEAHNTYPRRATSPTPSKSPSFSLFPQLPHAPEKIVGRIPPVKESPLQRSFTAPARLSPMQEKFDLEQVQPPKADDVKIDHQIVSSPPQSASTSDLKRDSFNPSVHSPTTTRSSVVEDVLLTTGSRGSLKRRQDQSEVMNDRELKVAPLKPKHVGSSNALSQSLTSQEVGAEPEKMNRLNIHEDTLAALERPRSISSKSKDASISLKPSKARIDQIMRGPPPNQLPESPEKSQPKVASEMPPNTVNAPGPRTGVEIVTRELATLAASAAVALAKEHKPMVTPHEQMTVPGSSHTRPQTEVELQHTKQSTETPRQPVQGSDALNPPERRPPNATQPTAGDLANAPDSRTRQPPHSFQSGKRQPPQFINGQAQPRPPVANVSHRLHPRANPPQIARPPFNPSNRFPTYRPPPPNFRMPPQHPSYQMILQQRPNAHSTTTPLTENDQDNIIDYYLDDTEANCSLPPPKSPKKLQKRPSDKAKKRFSLSKKPLPQPQPKSFQPVDTAPRSPVPISKYSPNAAAIQNSVISPPITSSTQSHNHSQSYCSTLAEQDPSDPHLLSPAVRAAREKAAKLIKASSTEDLGLTKARLTSISGPSQRPSRAEFSFIVDAPSKAPSNETSFYSHSNVSSPSLASQNSIPQTPDGGLGLHFSEQQAGSAFESKRYPSKGMSMSSLPPGAGGVESRSTDPKPPQPVRSASAGIVGVGAGAGAGSLAIQGHLKAERGEKVVERQAGLVPRIVEQERGHRPGRSVNLVIESV